MNPGDLKKKLEGGNGGAFGIFHLDSLKMHDSKKIYKNLLGWLQSELTRIYPTNVQVVTIKYPEHFIAPKGEKQYTIYHLNTFVTN